MGLTHEGLRAEHRRRFRCTQAYSRALRDGKLTKPTICPQCGRTVSNERQMHGHHANYDKPLEVTWACQSCHLRAHRAHDIAADEAKKAVE